METGRRGHGAPSSGRLRLDSRFVARVLGSKLRPSPCPSSSFVFPAQQGTFVICYSLSFPLAGLPVSVSQGLRLQAGDSMPDLNLLCVGVGARTVGGQRRTPSSSFLSLSPELGWEPARSRDLSVSALLFWVCSLPEFLRGS